MNCKYTYNVVMMLVVLLTIACKPQAPANTATEISTEINVEQAKNLIASTSDLKILDVRTPEEFDEGHLESAININFRDPSFESQIKALNTEDTYLVYCKSGGRSGEATELMKKLNFTKVSDMTDGYEPYAKSK